MPRPRKAPRLYLRRRTGRAPVWVILDGAVECSTGCNEDDARGAQEALARYLATKFTPPDDVPAGQLFIDEVMAVYLREHAAHSPSRDFLVYTAASILNWWSGKTLSEVNGANCRAYVEWRTGQPHRRTKAHKPISRATARHDLKTLRTAIHWYHAEHGPLPSVPVVTLPERTPQREDYWLTRRAAAARLRAALASERTRHVARFLLIGVYTGTRPGAILSLKWLPSPTGG
jgi:integrase